MSKVVRILLLLSVFVILSVTFLTRPAPAVHQDSGYVSPYSIVYSMPVAELLAPDAIPPRNDWRLQSSVPFDEWYSRRVLKQFGAWGPRARQYPPVPDSEKLPLTWKRQRLLAVAQKYIGLPYQHHHIPAWDPPVDWPWKPVAYGRNSPGVDCSDFTSWIYNYGLGIKLDTAIRQQAAVVDIAGPEGEGDIHAKTIYDDNGYDDLVRKLRAGDLLYIKNKKGAVSHVIMWVGEYGQSPDGMPLVIDSTGSDHIDCNGNQIPIGVQLRPFRPDAWYYKSFSHAHRILHERF